MNTIPKINNRYDQEIFDLLAKEARPIRMVEIAIKVKLSIGAVRKRCKNLEEQGLIKLFFIEECNVNWTRICMAEAIL